MPYITDNALKDSIAASMGLGSAASLPAHFIFNASSANLFAYNRIRAVLFDRGYSPAQVDAWDERTNWNEALGVTLAMWKSSKGDPDRGEPFRREYELQVKELLDYRIVINGVLANPAGPSTASRIGSGHLESSDFCPPTTRELSRGL